MTVRTGYEIREGSRMLAERIRKAQTQVAVDRGPAGLRSLEDGEREVNGRIRFHESWKQAA